MALPEPGSKVPTKHNRYNPQNSRTYVILSDVQGLPGRHNRHEPLPAVCCASPHVGTDHANGRAIASLHQQHQALGRFKLPQFWPLLSDGTQG